MHSETAATEDVMSTQQIFQSSFTLNWSCISASGTRQTPEVYLLGKFNPKWMPRMTQRSTLNLSYKSNWNYDVDFPTSLCLKKTIEMQHTWRLSKYMKIKQKRMYACFVLFFLFCLLWKCISQLHLPLAVNLHYELTL